VRRIAVLLGVAATLLVPAAPAAAHESAWVGHSYINGKHWRLVYDGYTNQYYGLPRDCTYYHYHWVDHYYRSNTNDAYGYRHEKPVYVGTGTGCPATNHTPGLFVGVPETSVDPENDVPELILSLRRR
jgi:hypothetical protein